MLRRMIPFLAFTTTLICVSREASAAAIDQPISGDNYSKTADIACNGTVNPNLNLTVKLVNMNGNPPAPPTIVDSANVTSDANGNWSYTFDPSDVGGSWTAGNYQVQLFKGSTMIAYVSITIGL